MKKTVLMQKSSENGEISELEKSESEENNETEEGSMNAENDETDEDSENEDTSVNESISNSSVKPAKRKNKSLPRNLGCQLHKIKSNA